MSRTAPYVRRTLRRLATAVALACGIGIAGDAHAVPAEPLVVVELFTSQGCASCPPADAFLGEIAQRKGVLALSLHVDYWNYMVWKDPFSSPQMSKRQKFYAGKLAQRYVYTPQMVIDGRAQDVGSNREAIEALLAEARRTIDKKLPLRVYRGNVNEVRVILPAAPAKSKKPDDAERAARRATLWLVAFDDKHVTEIRKGENRGKTLTHHNVVRAMRPVAEWDGKALKVVLNLADEIAAGYREAAVLLQSGGSGRILGAARFAMPVSDAPN